MLKNSKIMTRIGIFLGPSFFHPEAENSIQDKISDKSEITILFYSCISKVKIKFVFTEITV